MNSVTLILSLIGCVIGIFLGYALCLCTEVLDTEKRLTKMTNDRDHWKSQVDIAKEENYRLIGITSRIQQR